MNANPSGSRTPPAGGQGGLEARRENAVATGPSPGRFGAVGHTGIAGVARRSTRSPIGGTRHAMMMCRGARSARRAVQGRVGNHGSRHVVGHLETHPLLSANTSVSADVLRPLAPGKARPWPSAESTVRRSSSRPEAQPTDRSSPHLGARDTELVQPTRGAAFAARRWRSRGKGVLAV